MRRLEKLFRMVEESEEEIISTLCDLIAFRTINTGVMPTGHELPLCRYIQGKLAAEGLDSQILPSCEDRANLVARLKGSRGRPRLLLMAHTDVVPVEDETQWRFPPFAGVVDSGRVWGRGAADMKNLLAAEIMSMILLKRAGFTMAGDLILAAAADEEAGGNYGFGWLVRNAPDTILAEYGLNEGGGGTPVLVKRGLFYGISIGEKGRFELEITLRGKGSHAASPWLGQSAISSLGEVLGRIEAYKPDIDVSHPFFAAVLPILNHDGPVTVGNVDHIAGETMGRTPFLGSALLGLSRLTLTPTMVRGGIKSNVVSASCSITCDLRTLPNQDETYVRQQVESLLVGIPGASYKLTSTAMASASHYDLHLVEALRQATCAAAGRDDIGLIPALTLGFTDSRLVRSLGTTVYGFSPEHPEADPQFPANEHGDNESCSIRSVLFRTKVLIGLAFRLLGD